MQTTAISIFIHVCSTFDEKNTPNQQESYLGNIMPAVA